MRETKKSVTCFLQCGDQYLFVHRTKKLHAVDADRLNGIGGKLESGENYLAAALRETQEETGYVVGEADCRLAGVVSLSGGYAQDWVICFFVITVPTTEIPIGVSNDEGALLWLHKDAVLTAPYELVDDINYLWERIAKNEPPFFAHSIVNESEKIESISISQLKK
jgi:8-oxo-dGTP pyrophosphatase MutT (NUDIX family)